MGLKIAVLAGGTFEPERSVAAANDVIAALKEAEHEPELVMVDGGLVDTLLRSQPDVASTACAERTANPATSRTPLKPPTCHAWVAARPCAAAPTTRPGPCPKRCRHTTTSRKT